MATSNSTDFTQSRDQIISDALNLLGVYNNGDTISSNDYNLCSNILNKMIKGWESKGIRLWTQEEGVIFLTQGQNAYTLTTSNGSASGANINITTLSADASAGTSITVYSSLGMAVSDNIAVKVDSATYTRTTISAISGNDITLGGSLSGAASSGNIVMAYTTLLDRPLYINNARFMTATGSERPIKIVGRDEFENQNNKFYQGKVNMLYYSPKVSTSSVKVWPTPDSSEDCIRISYVRRIQDFDASGDTADLPQEWLEAITYNLAVRVASAFGIDSNKRDPSIPVIAAQSLQELELWDSEESSLRVVPNYRYDE